MVTRLIHGMASRPTRTDQGFLCINSHEFELQHAGVGGLVDIGSADQRLVLLIARGPVNRVCCKENAVKLHLAQMQ